MTDLAREFEAEQEPHDDEDQRRTTCTTETGRELLRLRQGSRQLQRHMDDSGWKLPMPVLFPE